MLEPDWDRSCADCRRWEYDDDPETPAGRRGLPRLDDDGRTPLPRVTDPPCRRCPKVPLAVVAHRQRTGGRVTPADAFEPGAEHRLAVEHFLECAAVGQFPDDGWVRRHAMLLRPLLRRVEQAPIRDMADLLRLYLREVNRG